MDERGNFLASGDWSGSAQNHDEEMSPFSKVILIFFGKQQSANYVSELQDENVNIEISYSSFDQELSFSLVEETTVNTELLKKRPDSIPG
jgi:hypothetical protein